MRHPVRNMIRALATAGIGLALLTGTAFAAYASDNSGMASLTENVSGDAGDTGYEDGDSEAAGENVTDSTSPQLKPLLPVEDLKGGSSSLQVDLVYADEEREEEIPVKEAAIDLYKVADLTTDNGAAHYVLTDAFAESGIEFEGMTASQSLSAAKKVNQIIDDQNILPTKTAETDEDGTALFTDLEPGIYLGRQREPIQISETIKITMEPVLWMTPMYALNEAQDMYEWDYSPEVLPKEGEVIEIPTPTPTNTPTPTPTATPTPTKKLTGTPTPTARPTGSQSARPTTAPGSTSSSTKTTTVVKTGDDAPIALYMVLAAAAVTLMAILAIRRHRS